MVDTPERTTTCRETRCLTTDEVEELRPYLEKKVRAMPFTRALLIASYGWIFISVMLIPVVFFATHASLLTKLLKILEYILIIPTPLALLIMLKVYITNRIHFRKNQELLLRLADTEFEVFEINMLDATILECGSRNSPGLLFFADIGHAKVLFCDSRRIHLGHGYEFWKVKHASIKAVYDPQSDTIIRFLNCGSKLHAVSKFDKWSKIDNLVRRCKLPAICIIPGTLATLEDDLIRYQQSIR